MRSFSDDVWSAAGVAWKHARRLIVSVIGTTVVLIGIAMIVLPGPAFIVIPVGLAILGTEFLWARRLLKRVKRQASHLKDYVTGNEPSKGAEVTKKD